MVSSSRPSGRSNGRRAGELRPLSFALDCVVYPEGSVLIGMGQTRVPCDVSLEDQVPHWLVGRGSGWLTAEGGIGRLVQRQREALM